MVNSLIRRNTSPRMIRRRRRVLAVVLAGAGLATAAWTGCSVEENYETLSFFFDGVPDPNAPSRVIRSGGDNVQLAIVSQHSAFEERRCEECHADSGEFGFVVSGFGELSSETCMKCHMDVFDEHDTLHGPVAQNECLWCHDPHESVHPHLMRSASPPLCLGCHSLELRDGPLIPEHEDLDRDCLDCHSGHGGPDTRFLKPGWPVDGPGAELAPEAESDSDVPADDSAVEAKGASDERKDEPIIPSASDEDEPE